MNDFNNFRDNYPTGFNGVEDQEEKTYIFSLVGEGKVNHYTEEEATEEFLNMTVRELLDKGFSLY